jgi:hypothetical protein
LENKKTFTIEVKNYNKDHFMYNQQCLMGKYKSKLAYTARDTSRRDIDNETGAEPNLLWGTTNQWISNSSQ